MQKRGFTIIELIVVITIMAIMLAYGVVNFRGSQTTSRDQERQNDVTNFSLALENFYKIGYSGSTTYNRYPSTDQLAGSTTTIIKSIFPDIDLKSLKAPDITDPVNTLVMATNSTATTAGVTPQPTTSQYVYQPLSQAGTLCSSSATMCQKYNIYYKLEGDGLVYQLQSKNQ